MHLLIVGSGASGVHLAITALERGIRVTMIDAGFERPPATLPTASFDRLKTELADPVGYFLGLRGEGVVYPATKSSYYGHPPSKQYVFRTPARFAVEAHRMSPLFSFATGGLAEAWTAGSYEFSAADLREFPFPTGDLTAGYRAVAKRIGISGVRDDLAAFIPFEADYLPALPADRASNLLLDRYAARREALNRRWRFFLGRSRVATLSRPHGDRPACDQLGRCLWGCPTDAIYSPAVTLRECRAHSGFAYLPGWLVSHYDYNGEGRVTGLTATPVNGGEPRVFTADQYALAAGALTSSKIVLESIHRRTGVVERLPGLMDNRQIHLPFLLPAMIGQAVPRDSYQFHHLAFGVERPDPTEYIHGQITTLRAASVHPVVSSLPMDFRGAMAAFRGLRSGLALANINLHDRRRSTSTLSIRPRDSGPPALQLDYADDPAEPGQIDAAVRSTRRALGGLGALFPPGMTRVLPKGASVHYAGTLPMSRDRARLGARPDGRSWDFPNLTFADGATFPFLPAKNLTFTLMANAVRLGRALGED
ncbi:MAG: GMC oxidoreductase [Gemmatimonadales bacterium]